MNSSGAVLSVLSARVRFSARKSCLAAPLSADSVGVLAHMSVNETKRGASIDRGKKTAMVRMPQRYQHDVACEQAAARGHRKEMA